MAVQRSRPARGQTAGGPTPLTPPGPATSGARGKLVAGQAATKDSRSRCSETGRRLTCPSTPMHAPMWQFDSDPSRVGRVGAPSSWFGGQCGKHPAHPSAKSQPLRCPHP